MPFSDPSWVWPYWLERQMDPQNPEFVPGTADAELVNLTHRNWTTIGTVGAPERATVDQRGLVSASADRWSLDWWIGAEDKWHLPSRGSVVRQRLLSDSPVIETAMRVPGGDALHRAYGYNSTELGPCAVVELENRTAVPYAVALAIRPYDSLGFAAVRTIDVDIDGGAATVFVNDHAALVLPRSPAHTVASTGGRGDAASLLVAGQVTAGWDGPVRDDDGWATAAFVFALPHTAMLRALIPLTDLSNLTVAAEPAGGRGGRSVNPARRRSSGPPRPRAVAFPEALPAAEQVAKGWEAQTRRGLIVSVPDERLMRAIEASRAQLLLLHGGDDLVTPGIDFDFEFADAARVVMALDEWGFGVEAAQVMRGWSERQSIDGTFVGRSDRLDANGTALAALARHWQMTGDASVVDDMVGSVAKAAHRLHKLTVAKRVERDPRGVGLLPVSVAPAYGGAPGAYWRDNALAIAGLDAVADALDAAHQPGVAEDARRFGGDLRTALDRLIAAECAGTADASAGPVDSQEPNESNDLDGPDESNDSDGPDDPHHQEAVERPASPLGATPTRRIDGGIVANIELVSPLGIYPPSHPVMTATLDRIRALCVVDDAVFRRVGQAGLDPTLTMLLALVEVHAGDERAWRRITWMLDHAGPTISWPSAVHPQTDGGSAGSGQDAVGLALFLTVVRHLLVRETTEVATNAKSTKRSDTGLALLSIVPPSWLGQPIDVRDAPTSLGLMSFSIRWHGARPALLWELEPHPGTEASTVPLTITVPGLDPRWSTDQRHGEALLASPAATPSPIQVEGGSFT